MFAEAHLGFFLNVCMSIITNIIIVIIMHLHYWDEANTLAKVRRRLYG